MSAQRQDGTPSGSALPLLYAGTVGKRRLSCPLFDSFMLKISSIFIMCFGAVSKCKLQENSPRQKLDKVVRIRFLMDSHDLFVGLIFR